MNNIYRYSLKDRLSVKADIDFLLDELFELEVKIKSEDFNFEEKLKLKKKTDELVTKIDMKKQILDCIDRQQNHNKVSLETERKIGNNLLWAFIASVGLATFYGCGTLNKTKADLRSLQSNYQVQSHHLSLMKDRNSKLAGILSLVQDAYGHIYDENGRLIVKVEELNKTKEQLIVENAIAWRWYDRHVEKISKLENELKNQKPMERRTYSSESPVVSFNDRPYDYCVVGWIGDKELRCYNNKTQTDYAIKVKGEWGEKEIWNGCVLRVTYMSSGNLIAYNPSSGASQYITGLYKLDNDGFPELVKKIQ